MKTANVAWLAAALCFLAGIGPACACDQSGALVWTEPGSYRLSIPAELTGCELIIRLRGAGGGAARIGRTRGGDGAFAELSLIAPVGSELKLTVGRGGGDDHSSGTGGKGADRAGSGGGLTMVDLAGTPLVVVGAGGGGGANAGGDGGCGGIEAGEDGRPGASPYTSGKGASQSGPGAQGSIDPPTEPREERIVLTTRPGEPGDGAGHCCGGGGGGGAGWFGGGGGLGNPEHRGRHTEYAGGGGGGGSGLVDSSRATIRVARLGGGGRGGSNNRPGQDASITIAWGPAGQVKAVDIGPQGAGDTGIVPLTSAASGRQSLEVGQLEIGALPPLSDITAVHMVSSRSNTGAVTVYFDPIDKPFVLVLTSNEAVRWSLRNVPPTLRGILVGSRTQAGRLVSVPEGIPARRLVDVGAVDPGSRQSRFNNPTTADQAVFGASGQHVTSFARDNRGGVVTVPGQRVSFEALQ